jgi:hypothetical protein
MDAGNRLAATSLIHYPAAMRPAQAHCLSRDAHANVVFSAARCGRVAGIAASSMDHAGEVAET